MDAASQLRRLIDHLRWADVRVLDGLRVAGSAEPRALEIFSHVLGAEHVWVSRILGRSSEIAVWPTITLDECRALAGRNAADLRDIVGEGAGAVMLREVAYVNSAGKPFRSTVEDIVLHVALHGMYHRGQVALLVRAGGGEPTPTDYIAFIRGAPAARRDAR